MTKPQFMSDVRSVFVWFGGTGPLDDVVRARLREHVEVCRASVVNAATSHQWRELMQWLGEYVRENFLTPEAMRKGFSMEDVLAFVDFMEQELNIA